MQLNDEFEALKFPVHAETRDGGVGITLLDDGRVLFDSPNSGREPEVVARCAPDSEAFVDFAVFWGRRFPNQARHSPGLTRLIYELRTGGLVQDPDYPFLFQDRCNPDALEDGAVVWPMLRVSARGGFELFTPGDFLGQHCLALAEDPRIKFFVRIEDVDGHDVATGAHVACMHKRRGLPLFLYECDAISAEALKGCVEGAPEVVAVVDDARDISRAPF